MVEDESVGALNLYSHGEASFGEEQEQVGLAFASQAAVAMANAQELIALPPAANRPARGAVATPCRWRRRSSAR